MTQVLSRPTLDLSQLNAKVKVNVSV